MKEKRQCNAIKRKMGKVKRCTGRHRGRKETANKKKRKERYHSVVVVPAIGWVLR